MRKLTKKELEIIRLHGMWLRGEPGGKWANLYRADLSGAKLDLPLLTSNTQVCPQTGAFTAWKKVQSECVVELRIPSGARRLTYVGSRKCRAERAIVRAIYAPDGSRAEKAYGNHGPSFLYEVGKVVSPDKYDANPLVECSHGIHFFITREEAERW
jgi:hypothetical protein